MHVMHVNLAACRGATACGGAITGVRGGERQTLLLIQALKQYGVFQSAAVRADSWLAAKLQDESEVALYALRRPFFRHLGGLAAALRRRKGIIHAHEAQASQLAFMLHRLSRMPYLITRRVPKRPKANVFTRAVYRHAARVVTLSEAIAGAMTAYQPSLGIRMCMIPSMTAHFVPDPGAVAVIRARFGNGFLVGQVGALVMRHKGQQHLIEAARRLCDDHQLRERRRDIQFLLLGAGEDEQTLRDLAHGLDHVHFLGFKDNIADYLAALDVFVYPSLEEGLGSAILDAMELGIPVVATQVGGIPEIVRHGHTGLLIAPADPEAITHTVLALHTDPGLRQHLSRQAREYAVSFAPERIGRQYLEVYKTLVLPE